MSMDARNYDMLSPEVAGAVVEFLERSPAHFIGGRRVPPTSGLSLPVEDPGLGRQVGEIARGDATDIAAAVDAASEGFKKWSAMRPSKRAEILESVAQLIRQRIDLIGAIESIDTGKPFAQATGEAWWAADAFRYYAGWTTKIEGTTNSPLKGVIAAVIREPAGVCGAITAWNFPLVLTGFKIAPALGFGNSLVVKPAEEASLSTLYVAELLMEAGAPAGLLNVVTGLGEAAGAALVDHPGIQRLTFTGSTAVGRSIAARAAGRLVDVSLELGGKSPHVVFAGANLEQAARGVFRGMYQNAGQMCAAGTRIIVHRSIRDELAERLGGHAEASVVGHGLETGSTIGPLITRQQLGRTESYVAAAVAAGATLTFGGRRRGPTDTGFFYLPTLLEDTGTESPVWREEIFGPVAAMIPFDSPDEAVALANDTDYGLGAGIWGGDMEVLIAAAQQIRAGSVWLNGYGMVHPAVPFGGFGDSGMGRELGGQLVDFYTERKSIWLGLQGQSI